MNTIEFLDETARNFRLSLRMLRRNPGFALTAVLVLALGLGASTAMFSALDRILFRPLPYADADRLVNLGWTLSAALTGPGQTQTVLASRGYRERWKPAPEPFTAVTTVFNATGVGSTCDVTEQPAERLVCPTVESNFLETLGVRPALGRDFTAEDDLPVGSSARKLRGVVLHAVSHSDHARRTARRDHQPRRLDAPLRRGHRRDRANHRSERESDSRDRRSAIGFRDAWRRRRSPPAAATLPAFHGKPVRRIHDGVRPAEAGSDAGTGQSRRRADPRRQREALAWL
jgi:hypothetical protein